MTCKKVACVCKAAQLLQRCTCIYWNSDRDSTECTCIPERLSCVYALCWLSIKSQRLHFCIRAQCSSTRQQESWDKRVIKELVRVTTQCSVYEQNQKPKERLLCQSKVEGLSCWYDFDEEIFVLLPQGVFLAFLIKYLNDH